MDPVTDVKLLKVARFKTLAKLIFFTRYFFKKRENRRFDVSPHHEVITDALDRVLQGKCRRLIINVPPRYGKTELAVKNFMGKGLAHNPSARFIHLSYSAELALDNSEAVKDMVTSEEYQELFPEVEIKKDSKAKKKWYTTKGGGVYATAAAGQVTGFGAGKVDDPDDEQEEEEPDDFEGMIEEFTSAIKDAESPATAIAAMSKFGGALIIDDPIKPEDADSETVRERVNNRWDSTISNRVNSRKTPIIIVMQRLHDQDLCGKLIERDGKIEDGGEWEVISLQSLSTDPEGNQVALWPQKHTVEELLDMQKKTPIVFGRQYQQNPQPLEGLLFPKSQLQYFNPATVNLEGVAEYRFFTCDPADDGGDDLSAPFGYLVDKKVYIPFVIYNKDGTDVNQPAMVHEIKSRKMNAGVIEGVGAWKLFAKAVRAEVQETYDDCEIRIIGQSKNKHTRILAMAAWIVNNCVFRDDWEDFPGTPYYRFMKCLTSYMKVQTGTTKAAHDDAPDSLAEMAKHFQSVFAHLF